MAQATNSNSNKQKDSPKTRAAKSAAAKAAATARRRTIKRVVGPDRARPINGFMDFVRQQGVVGLAVGLAIGTQVKAVVDQIVMSFINPTVGLVLPGDGDLIQKKFSLTIGDKTAVFTYGSFLNVLISFIAVCAVIYFIVKGLKLDKIDKKKEV